MQVIKPTPSQSAFIMTKFFKERDIAVSTSQAQEVIARMWGYANWNALTSHIDPRVGDPKGKLQQESETVYTLLGGVQTSIMIAVNNLQVCLKHEDEGVVVDVFSKTGLDKGEESLGSTWVMFNEVEEGESESESDVEDDAEDDTSIRAAFSGVHFAKLLLTAEKASGAYDTSHRKIWHRDNEALHTFIRDGAKTTLDKNHLVLAYGQESSHCKVFVRDLLAIGTIGEDGWVLENGTKIWIHQRNKANIKVAPDIAELLRALLNADKLTMSESITNAPIVGKNNSVIQQALQGEDVDLTTEVLAIRTVRDNVLEFTIGVLLASFKQVSHGVSYWHLPSGLSLSF